MADFSAAIERILDDEDLPDALVTKGHYTDLRTVLTRHLSPRQSGDRALPPPYDKMNAADREAWLICEGLFDGALTEDVRRANAGHEVASWADLNPLAHQALVSMLGEVIPVLHAVALNPKARAETTDG